VGRVGRVGEGGGGGCEDCCWESSCVVYLSFELSLLGGLLE